MKGVRTVKAKLASARDRKANGEAAVTKAEEELKEMEKEVVQARADLQEHRAELAKAAVDLKEAEAEQAELEAQRAAEPAPSVAQAQFVFQKVEEVLPKVLPAQMDQAAMKAVLEAVWKEILTATPQVQTPAAPAPAQPAPAPAATQLDTPPTQDGGGDVAMGDQARATAKRTLDQMDNDQPSRKAQVGDPGSQGSIAPTALSTQGAEVEQCVALLAAPDEGSSAASGQPAA